MCEHHAASASRSRGGRRLLKQRLCPPLLLVELYLICAFGEGGFGAVRAPGQGKGVGSVLHRLRSCSSSCQPHWRAVDQLESSSLNTKPDLGELPGAYYNQCVQDCQLKKNTKNLGWNVSFNCKTADALIWISPWYAAIRPPDPSEQMHNSKKTKCWTSWTTVSKSGSVNNTEQIILKTIVFKTLTYGILFCCFLHIWKLTCL